MDYKIALSFKVHHPQDNLEFLKTLLGVEPFRSWNKDEVRLTPKGKHLEGVYKNSYCCLRFNNNEKKSICEHLEIFLDKVEPHRDELLKVIDTGGSMGLDLFFLENDKIVEVINWSILKRLSDLKISLGFDC